MRPSSNEFWCHLPLFRSRSSIERERWTSATRSPMEVINKDTHKHQFPSFHHRPPLISDREYTVVVALKRFRSTDKRWKNLMLAISRAAPFHFLKLWKRIHITKWSWNRSLPTMEEVEANPIGASLSTEWNCGATWPPHKIENMLPPIHFWLFTYWLINILGQVSISYGCLVSLATSIRSICHNHKSDILLATLEIHNPTWTKCDCRQGSKQLYQLHFKGQKTLSHQEWPDLPEGNLYTYWIWSKRQSPALRDFD